MLLKKHVAQEEEEEEEEERKPRGGLLGGMETANPNAQKPKMLKNKDIKNMGDVEAEPLSRRERYLCYIICDAIT